MSVGQRITSCSLRAPRRKRIGSLQSIERPFWLKVLEEGLLMVTQVMLCLEGALAIVVAMSDWSISKDNYSSNKPRTLLEG